MTILSTLPQVVDVDHYAGDTLTMHVLCPTEVIAGRTFSAQVRANKSATKIDATFGVLLTPTGCDIVLFSADSRELTRRGDYEGFWDVQLAAAGGADPVTTLAYGELRIHLDVTRPAP